MKIKNYILILISFCMLMFCPSVVKATDGYVLNMELSNINENNEITLEINSNKLETSILAMQATIIYDKNILEITDSKVFKTNWNITAFNKDNGTFMLEINDEKFYDESSYIKSNEKILEIQLKFKDKKNTEIKVSDIKIVDVNFETIEVDELSKNLNTKNDMLSIRNIVIIIVILFMMIITIGFFIHKKK